MVFQGNICGCLSGEQLPDALESVGRFDAAIAEAQLQMERFPHNSCMATHGVGVQARCHAAQGNAAQAHTLFTRSVAEAQRVEMPFLGMLLRADHIASGCYPSGQQLPDPLVYLGEPVCQLMDDTAQYADVLRSHNLDPTVAADAYRRAYPP